MSRREEILAAAVRLFRTRGVDGVSVDAVGAAVGLSGAALYRHFPGGKPELLLAAFESAGERLVAALDGCERPGSGRSGRSGRSAPPLPTHGGTRRAGEGEGQAGDPAAARARLERIVAAYVDVALESSDLIALYLGEGHALPPAVRERLRRGQRRYLARWADTVVDARPGTPPAAALALAHGAVAMVNAAVQRPSGLPLEHRRRLLRALAGDALLGGAPPAPRAAAATSGACGRATPGASDDR